MLENTWEIHNGQYEHIANWKEEDSEMQMCHHMLPVDVQQTLC